MMKKGMVLMTHKRASSLLILAIAAVFCSTLSADDWPQWRGSDRDGVWTEDGIVSQFTESSLEVVWRQPIRAGYTGPTVADGRVFVMDRISRPEQLERILCFDAKTGKPLWEHQYPTEYGTVQFPAGPRASVTVDGPRVYALGATGTIHCLSAAEGEKIWSRDLDEEYAITAERRMPIWGIAASPLIYEDLVILHIGAVDGASIVALDKSSGQEKWRALNDRAQYSSPIVCRQNGKDVLVCWTGDSVAGIEPLSGKVFWRFEFKPTQMPIGVATPIIKDGLIFMTSFYDGSLMLRLKQDEMGVEKVWAARGVNERSTKALHSMIGTPVWIGQHIYGVDSYGELRCLEALSGKRVWESDKAVPRSRWSTIHFVQRGDETWMFNERGELILSKLTPQGFEEICRAKLIEPTTAQLRQRGGVCWSPSGVCEPLRLSTK